MGPCAWLAVLFSLLEHGQGIEHVQAHAVLASNQAVIGSAQQGMRAFFRSPESAFGLRRVRHRSRLQEAMMQVVQAHGPMAMPVVGTVCGPMPMVCQAPVVPRLNSVTWRNRPA